MIKNFYDLTVWEESHDPSIRIYEVTKKFPPEEKFGITGQLRRAFSSVSANSAEGFGKFHFKDKVRFYYTARGFIRNTEFSSSFTRIGLS